MGGFWVSFVGCYIFGFIVVLLSVKRFLLIWVFEHMFVACFTISFLFVCVLSFSNLCPTSHSPDFWMSVAYLKDRTNVLIMRCASMYSNYFTVRSFCWVTL